MTEIDLEDPQWKQVEVARYAAAGLRIFPVKARGAPLTQHGFKDASSDPEVIKVWSRRWAHGEFGWAVPADVVVIDLDEKNGKHGLRDFRDRAGCDPRDVATPQATTPSGGRHIVYRATKAYRNLVGIEGTGIDTRTEGGYVVLPSPGNGRQWVRPLIGLDGAIQPLLPAPAWLDVALRKAPLVLAPRAALAQPSSNSWAQKKARSELEKTCAKIVTAPLRGPGRHPARPVLLYGRARGPRRPQLRGGLCGPPRGGVRHAGLS